MAEDVQKPGTNDGHDGAFQCQSAFSVLRATLVGAVIAVGFGWLAWVMVVLYLGLFAGVDDADALMAVMHSQAMMFRLLPVTFVTVLVAILVAGRAVSSGSSWVALGVALLTALSVTPPFALLPSVHGNYLPIAAAAAVGAFLLGRRSKKSVTNTGDRQGRFS